MKEAMFPTSAAASYDASRFCSTQTAANLLGISHRTVQLWVENGTLIAWKTAGGHRRIAMDTIEKLVSVRQDAVAVPKFSPETAPDKKVLLVDQDYTLLSLYELKMRDWGLSLTIVKAFDGFEALLQVGEKRPDLLIADLSLPGMDGGRLIHALRKNASSEDIAIIVISSLETNTIKAIGLPSDIAVFTKPVPFDQLKIAVEWALGTTC